MLAQQVLNHCTLLVRDDVVFGAGHKLASAGLALMILFAAVNMAVFLNCGEPHPGHASRTTMAAVGLPDCGGVFGQQ
jgi:hypothetical protein